MSEEDVLKILNAAINKYFETKTILAGNFRYWEKVFVTADMLKDESLVRAFREVLVPPINTEVEETTEGEASERKHKATYAKRIPKPSSRDKSV